MKSQAGLIRLSARSRERWYFMPSSVLGGRAERDRVLELLGRERLVEQRQLIPRPAVYSR
jgi:hypothetical protein